MIFCANCGGLRVDQKRHVCPKVSPGPAISEPLRLLIRELRAAHNSERRERQSGIASGNRLVQDIITDIEKAIRR